MQPGSEELATWVSDARQRTLDLVADLSDDQLAVPCVPTVNPLLWEVGHLAWFQEKFVLRAARGAAPILDYGDAIWDSGAIPHDTRWRLCMPGRDDTVAYLHEVRDRVVAAVLDPAATDVVRHFARYTVHHEDTHDEALTYTRQALAYPAPKLSSGASSASAGDPLPAAGDVEVPGGTYLLGATMSEPFVYDNEKWAHPVNVSPFRIARSAVTQAEFAAFVDDGGYVRSDLWGDGAQWLATSGAQHPLYWRRWGDRWQRRRFDSWIDLEPNRPVCHVSYHEAAAYCRWADRRLPTEAEWEVAATGLDVGSRKRSYPWGDEAPTTDRANLDWEAMDTVDVGACPAGESPYGLRQLVGNVWEWTESTFGPYPNFERDAYADNSEPWFGSRKVLRGGAWATRGRYVRTTFRNYFIPDRRDVFAGFRTCVR